MPKEVFALSTVDDNNSDPDQIGFPELMPRSDVNNRMREFGGALRRWYEDAEWTRQLEQQNGTAFVVSKLSDTSIRVTGADASALFPVGTRLRVSISGGSAVEGFIQSVISGDPTDVTIDFPPSATLDEAPSPTWAGLGTSGSPTPTEVLVNTPVVPGSVRIEDTSLHTGGEAITDDGAGNLTHPVDGVVGSVTYTGGTAGEIVVTGLSVAFDSNVTIDYQSEVIVPATSNRADLYLNRSLREAAFRSVGTGSDDIPSNFDLGSSAFKDEGPESGLDADTVDGKHAQDIIDEVSLASRNFLINGSFRVAQRGTPLTSTTAFPNSNGSYTLDRWLLLSDGNDRVDVSRSNDVPTGPQVCRNAIQLEVETVTGSPSSEQFGICQVLEGKDAAAMLGKNVSFSFWAKGTGTINFIRAAVVSWTSTEDTLATYPVQTWAVGPLAGRTNANWVVEGESDQLTVTGTYAQFKVENVAIDAASAANVGVLVWIDEQDFGLGDTLLISACQLEIGATASQFKDRPMAEEIMLCQRYFQKTFPIETAPVQSGGNTGSLLALKTFDGTNDGTQWRFTTPIRKVPVAGDFTYYNPGAADANWSDGTTPDAASELSDQSVSITGGVTLTTGDRVHATVEVEL